MTQNSAGLGAQTLTDPHTQGPFSVCPACCDPALLPDTDLNVLSQPPIMLVILLNVSLNTLPMLAFRVIYQALKKPQRKVRGGGPHHTWRTPTARACAGNWDLKERQR